MCRVRILLGLFLLATAGTFAHFPNVSAQSQQQPQNPTQTQSPATPQVPQTPLAQPSSGLRTVVLDPGHGGEDTGARGPTGVAERDIALEFAQTIAGPLRAEGFAVVLTRTGDADPSPDDRDAIANAQNNAILISLHVGSAGTAGTVQTYTYLFPATPPPALSSNQNADASAAPAAPPPGFLVWSEAQKPFVPQSVKLGDLIQVELAQKFKGSSEVSMAAPVAVLRSAAVPAVAVEVSSVAVDQQKLEAMGGDLAFSIARAVQAYKTIYPPGGE
ncbi:MAG TPA: N-acetylmuramoyl-L-alanine amidase [Candidatus Acidoferrales bacterium]|nr:N-acetylmuramoyl-L-alanine amidase [Candidatus Acidoferrales bacterium]